jgi:CubicO group peptidase (beta-lactamase class C family)
VLGFGLVRAGEEAWVAGLGFADLDARCPATGATAFHPACVSKVVTGTALMQLSEAGRLLPFIGNGVKHWALLQHTTFY